MTGTGRERTMMRIGFMTTWQGHCYSCGWRRRKRGVWCRKCYRKLAKKQVTRRHS